MGEYMQPMTDKEILAKTESYVKETLAGDGTGHDWWHIQRVVAMAKRIAAEEKQGDPFIIELAALLHDIADWKFHNGDEYAGERRSREWLTSLHADTTIIDHVCEIVRTISYKGGTNSTPIATVEGRIVQDADRLDALGAIGIARTFAYGGWKGRPIYDPEESAAGPVSFEEYKTHTTSSVHHFYEKLLLLKDRMNTKAAKRIAARRHTFLETFLAQFLSEWKGEGSSDG